MIVIVISVFDVMFVTDKINSQIVYQSYNIDDVEGL